MAGATAWPHGSGELACLIREHDWPANPVGPIDAWPDRLRAAVEIVLAVPQPAFVCWGKDLSLLYNDDYRLLLGARHPGALGRPLLDVWDGLAGFLAPAVAAIRAGKSYGWPVDVAVDIHSGQKGHTSRWFTGAWAPLRDDAGVVSGFFSVGQETTARVLTERALRESEERYRAIIEQATDYAIFTVDTEGRIETWTPGSEAVFGWTEAEAVGQSFAMTYTPEDQAADVPERELAQSRDEGGAPNVRWHQSKGGGRVYIEGVARARRSADGTFLGILKVGRDATERRLAEQRRQDEENRVRAELERRVAEATAELRALSRRLLLAQEEERRRLALELHDEIGQALTGLGLTLGAGAATDTARLADARRLVAELTDQVRQLSMELRPEALDRYGLLPALRWLLDRYQVQTGLRVDLYSEGVDGRLPPEVELAAYRVVQEALTNVARHSGAQEAAVRLHVDGSVLTIGIRDFGAGFNKRRVAPGSGLGGMRERTELLGGTLEVDAAPGEGVTVTAELPVDLHNAPNGLEHLPSQAKR